LSIVVAVEEEIVITTTVHQSKLMLFRFFVLSKIAETFERFSADLLVHRSKVFVEEAALRELQFRRRERVVPDPDPDGPNIADAITDLSRLAATGRRTSPQKDRTDRLLPQCNSRTDRLCFHRHA
jgi:hypothetical protein